MIGSHTVEAARATQRAAGWSDARVALVIACAAATVGIAGSWIPSLWGEEAASLMSARRDWESLAALLGNVDAVHGLYYAVLHVWTDLAGTSPFAVRLPSGLAYGAAAAGLYLLVRTRADRVTALTAAVVLCVVPRISQAATEARPLAFATACAVWLTVLLAYLMDGRMPRGWWWGYSVGLALSVYLNLYLVLMLPIHAIALALHPQRRARLVDFAFPAAVALVLATPIIVVAAAQRQQVAFRADQDVVTLDGVLVGQWFMLGSFAVVSWMLVAASVAVGIASARDPAWAGERWLLGLGLAWFVLPTAVLLIATEVLTPLYTPRYLVFCAPGVAIAVAIAVGRMRPNVVGALVLAVIIGLAVPAYVDQRTPYAKNLGTDWQAVSATVGSMAEPGDGVLFDESVRPSLRPRLAMYTYPDGFVDLVDLGLVRAHHETDRLWDVTAPLAELRERLDGIDRVIVVARSPDGVEPDVDTLRASGFVELERRPLETDVVRLFARDPTHGAASASR
ncbi:glycosyltransferase family 39 protein [Agromyces sp. Marseille-P2726]|uniref:glycosyltransferase family 39 protein n=1 Tax=Agromyces sp. Marseille-P2726 TaxID=2709132 RepID=UPI00157084B3|nr:glycosyltransferase family 39 protein [Agromyces sp. Marseille-P2726]